MKIRVKAPFFDERGIHKKGEICEVQRFNPLYMEPIAEEKKEKVEKAVKKRAFQDYKIKERLKCYADRCIFSQSEDGSPSLLH